MTPEERARHIYEVVGTLADKDWEQVFVRNFKEAIREAYEDAAKIAMEYDTEKHANTAVSFNTASAIAAAIRARIK
jgi:hypothetical protein